MTLQHHRTSHSRPILLCALLCTTLLTGLYTYDAHAQDPASTKSLTRSIKRAPSSDKTDSKKQPAKTTKKDDPLPSLQHASQDEDDAERVLRTLKRAQPTTPPPNPTSSPKLPPPRTAKVIFSTSKTTIPDPHKPVPRKLTSKSLQQKAKGKGKAAPKKPYVIPSHFVFQKPVRTGRLTSHYGMRRDPVKRKGRKRRRKMHKGTDWAAPKGTPIYSTGPGTVIYAAYKSNGNGNCVFIKHPGGWVSIYLHLSKIRVKKGDIVRPRQRIGDMGNTGRSTGNHLHFQVEYRGHAVNPVKLIGKDSRKVKKP